MRLVVICLLAGFLTGLFGPFSLHLPWLLATLIITVVAGMLAL